jgi:hypothetical protein
MRQLVILRAETYVGMLYLYGTFMMEAHFHSIQDYLHGSVKLQKES